jgi:hypothetical protein
MHVALHESTPDFPLRKFRIVRGDGHETRFSHLDHLSIMVIRLPDEQFSLHLIQDAQPIRFLWHVQRVEKRLRFHRCSVEIVGDYQNPIAAPFPVSNFHRLPHSIHRVTEALERLMEEDAAADRPFIAALAISSKARGTSHKPYTLLTAFDRPHFLIGKSEMVTNFMHQNMSNNRIQRELTSRPKIEDRIPIEKNPIW